MFVHVRSRRIWGVVVLAALVCAPLQAGDVPWPRDELLRFVPEDVVFCVVVKNVRENGKVLGESPFAEQFRKSVAGAKLRNEPGINQRLSMERELTKNFGIGWDGLRDDSLGDAVVFAYRPGKKGEGQDLMLIRARNEEALKSLINHFNKAQGLEEVKESTHNGVKYYTRVDKRETNYYLLRGSILVFSSQEEMLKRAIDVDRAAAADGNTRLTTLLRQLGADRAMVAVAL